MKLSVIIAACNSEPVLPDLMKRLSYQEVADVVVVDRGSRDNTIAVARSYGVHLSRAAGKSLGEMWNAGYQLSANEILWFLKAESRVPMDAASRILDAMEDHPESVGGCFRLRTAESTILTKAGKVLTALFGPQDVPENGVFLLESVVRESGGFPDSDTPMSDICTIIAKQQEFLRLRGSIVEYVPSPSNGESSPR